MSDAHTTADGKRMLLDTPRNWEFWRRLVDPQLASEAAGGRPPGFATWNEKWVKQLRSIDESQENASKYTSYIIEHRRLAGLPELTGYP